MPKEGGFQARISGDEPPRSVSGTRAGRVALASLPSSVIFASSSIKVSGSTGLISSRLAVRPPARIYRIKPYPSSSGMPISLTRTWGCLSLTTSVTSSTWWMRYSTSPAAFSTGELTGLQ